MSIFDLFKKGEAPVDSDEPVYTELSEIPFDSPPAEDGDNTDLHDEFKHLVTPEQIAAHEAEVAE